MAGKHRTGTDGPTTHLSQTDEDSEREKSLFPTSYQVNMHGGGCRENEFGVAAPVCKTSSREEPGEFKVSPAVS